MSRSLSSYLSFSGYHNTKNFTGKNPIPIKDYELENTKTLKIIELPFNEIIEENEKSKTEFSQQTTQNYSS